MQINVVGYGIFLLSLGLGGVGRLAVPDHMMNASAVPLSQAASIATGVYVVVLAGWILLFLRCPRIPALAAFGAVWSSLGAAFLARDVWLAGQWSAVPPLATLASLCLLTFLHWRWLMRT
jgi:hypothetical protein